MDTRLLFSLSIIAFCIHFTFAQPSNKKLPCKKNGKKVNGADPVSKLLKTLGYEGRPKTDGDWEEAFAAAAKEYETLEYKNGNPVDEWINNFDEEVEKLKRERAEDKEKLNKLILRIGTLTIGEAQSQMRRKRHPENFDLLTPDPEVANDDNRCSLIRDRNFNVAHGAGNILPGQGETFSAKFTPVADDLSELLQASDYFFSKGRENEMHKIFSGKSYAYVKSSPDFLINWGCYCIENFGKVTSEDEKEMAPKIILPTSTDGYINTTRHQLPRIDRMEETIALFGLQEGAVGVRERFEVLHKKEDPDFISCKSSEFEPHFHSLHTLGHYSLSSWTGEIPCRRAKFVLSCAETDVRKSISAKLVEDSQIDSTTIAWNILDSAFI